MTALRVQAALRWWLLRLTRWPLAALCVVLALAVASLQLAASELGFDTNTDNLLDPDIPFRQHFSRYTEQFPQYQNTLVAVVEAPAPSLAEAAAERLARALEQRPEMFPRVYRPRGDEFLERNGLLYLDPDRLAEMTDRLAAAQPLLARLYRDPSLAGYLDLLREIVERRGTDSGLEPVFEASARALAGGDDDVVAWGRLLQGDKPMIEGPARALVVTTPQLDYDRVMAGRAAMQRLDAVIAETPLGHPEARVRVTGKVALQHEELVSALGGAQQAGLAALGLVTLVLYLALRSWRLLLVALVTLAVGMSLSAGAATLAVGHLNLISIAFAVLYVGLGINYALHYLIRFREALNEGQSRQHAVITAGERLGGALTLCTVTTAIGFFAFLPTDFAGVAELGLIAGLSMFITLGVTYTLLPAMLALVPVPADTAFDPRPPLAGLGGDWPERHRVTVCAGSLLLAMLGAGLASQARFDHDPLNMRDPTSESVVTARALLRDGGDVQRSLVVLGEDAERLAALAERLESLDSVRATVGLSDLVPGRQEQKLEQIRDLEFLLGPTVSAEPLRLADTPDVSATAAAAARLRLALDGLGAAGSGLERMRMVLTDWIDRLRASADPAMQVQASQARTLGTLPLAIERLQTVLHGASPFTAADLPAPLHDRFRSPGGAYLLQVFPSGDLGDPAIQQRFVETVQSVVPDVTGVPVLQVESGRAVVAAFRTALAGAIAGITLVLLLLLRHLGTTVRVLIPLLLGGLLTVATMVLLGVPFNFANVIALPLLLGVGVDNGIHMVSRQRERGGTGAGALHTSTARAILFGSLATIASFGNLALSPHQGTATMGVVLALGMVLILATTFLVLPALFARPVDVPAAGRS